MTTTRLHIMVPLYAETQGHRAILRMLRAAVERVVSADQNVVLSYHYSPEMVSSMKQKIADNAIAGERVIILVDFPCHVVAQTVVDICAMAPTVEVVYLAMYRTPRLVPIAEHFYSLTTAVIELEPDAANGFQCPKHLLMRPLVAPLPAYTAGDVRVTNMIDVGVMATGNELEREYITSAANILYPHARVFRSDELRLSDTRVLPTLVGRLVCSTGYSMLWELASLGPLRVLTTEFVPLDRPVEDCATRLDVLRALTSDSKLYSEWSQDQATLGSPESRLAEILLTIIARGTSNVLLRPDWYVDLIVAAQRARDKTTHITIDERTDHDQGTAGRVG